MNTYFDFNRPADLTGGCPMQALHDLDAGEINRAEYDAVLASYDEAENLRLARASALLA